jgi:Tfp pilus assembly PilM family ATPase
MTSVFRSRHVVAFDASGVAGATLTRSLSGWRVRALAQVPLGEGALSPSPFERNVARSADVRTALREVAQTLDLDRTPVCLVLPDGVARIVSIDLPGEVTAAAYARYRLAPTLPYPADEAMVEVMPIGPRRVLAAAARRAVLHEYEEVAAEAGLVQQRVDLAPLAALAALGERRAEASVVDLVLGDAAFSMAARDERGVAVFRNRRRDRGPGEPSRLRDEADRTAALAGQRQAARLRVVGAGAGSILRELALCGVAADAGWRLPGESLPAQGLEMAWLGAALG